MGQPEIWNRNSSSALLPEHYKFYWVHLNSEILLPIGLLYYIISYRLIAS